VIVWLAVILYLMRGFAASAKGTGRGRFRVSHFAWVVLSSATMMRPSHCLVLLAGAGVMAGCQQDRGDQPRAAPTTEAAAPPAVPLPIAEPPLDREALLLAVARAASATAGGPSDAAEQPTLDGKRFELRSRFGCAGPTDDGDEPQSWRFDDKRRVLRIRVVPNLTEKSPLVGALLGGAYEAVEGFWIGRPWLLVAACPPTSVAPPASEASEAGEPSGDSSGSAAAVPEHRVGIARFFTATDARTHRRDRRAYQVTQTLATDEAPSSAGYDLVISGRLRRLSDGRVITCRQPNADTRPSCVISAVFDNVAVLRADNGEPVAEWSSTSTVSSALPARRRNGGVAHRDRASLEGDANHRRPNGRWRIASSS
jgi:hypothetical protein